MNRIKAMATAAFFLLALAGNFVLSQKKESDQEIYEKAKRAIYQKDWQAAVKDLEKLLKNFERSDYFDDSLYWVGYSLNKISEGLDDLEKEVATKKEALEKLNKLIEQFSSSSWLDNAKVLRIEIAEKLVKYGHPEFRKYIEAGVIGGVEGGVLGGIEGGVRGGIEGGVLAGKEKSEKEKEEDPELEMKLVALNALMAMDREKAFPILEKIVRENAIFWLGQRKEDASVEALLKIYDQTEDPALKEKIIFSLSQNDSQKAVAKLFSIARGDADPKARERAVFWLGQKKEAAIEEALFRLYDETNDEKLKERLIFSFSQANTKKALYKLIEIARKEENLALKKKAIFWLGQSRDDEAIAFLKELIEK